jgi:hypothetical protein
MARDSAQPVARQANKNLMVDLGSIKYFFENGAIVSNFVLIHRIIFDHQIF